MRPNRRWLLSLAASGILFAASSCGPKPMQQVEIPVIHQPPRAANEELVENPMPSRPATAPTAAKETAVAAAPKEEPTEPKPTPATVASAAEKKPATTEPAAKKYGIENYRLVNQSDEIVTVLKNGMVVITKRMPSPVLAVRGYVQTGGVYEGKWLGGGLSHLLEHLVAGGSSQRRTEAQNRDLLQKIGNDSNAYTTEDHTAYFINTTNEHLVEAVDLVTGWMLGALITPEEYKREYEVVQRELEKDKGEPDWVFYELGQQLRYRVNPARVPVIGYQEVIQGLSRDDVFGYYKQNYQPNNMIFSVTGDADPETMLRAVQKFVDDSPPGRVPSRVIEPEPPVLSPRTQVATFPKLGQARLQLAFPSVSLNDPDLYPLDLLSTILGGGESSILVEELRDKRKLVTAVGCNNPTPSYVDGSFQVEMELAPDKISAATDAAVEIINKVIADGVSEDQLKRAKVQMRANRVRSLQTSEDMAASLATDYMQSGDPHFTDRYLKLIEEVSDDRIKEVAKKYFVRDKILTTALLPAEYVGSAGLPKAEDLLRPVAPTTKESAPAAEMPQITRVELPNGTILLHKRMANSPLVEIKMFALGGLTDEDAKNNGIGMLTMESLARGTRSKNAQQIAEFFDSIGGRLDTSCERNSWTWSVNCMKGDFEKAMDVFADVINNPAFADAEVAQMKERQVAAIESQDADWFQQATRYFKQQYFGPMNSPYQFIQTGKKETVEKLTPADLGKWYSGHVLKGRRVIAIFGDVDLDKAKAVAQEKLGGGDKINSEAESSHVAEHSGGGEENKPYVKVERVEVQKTEQPLAGIVIGYDSASVVGDPANYSIDVADTMCSGFTYPTGYLHEILRGRGLVYMVHAQNWPGKSAKMPGTFLVYAGCDPGKVNEVIDIILENIARLQGSEKDTQPGWFERSKQLITTADSLDHETPAQQAMQAALDELYGLGYDFHDQFIRKIDAVKPSEVTKIAHTRLTNCVVTVSTPAPDDVKIKTGERTYGSFPPVDLTPRGVQHDAGK